MINTIKYMGGIDLGWVCMGVSDVACFLKNTNITDLCLCCLFSHVFQQKIRCCMSM